MATDYITDEQIQAWIERIASARGWPDDLLSEVLAAVEDHDYATAAAAVREWGGDGAEKAEAWLLELGDLPEDYYDLGEELVTLVTDTAEDLASTARAGVPLGLVLGGAVLLWLVLRGRRR